MIEDEVVREVRAAREAFAAEHGFDIRAMAAALQKIEAASGHEVVRLAPRPVQERSRLQQDGPTTAAPSTPSSLDAARSVVAPG
jgi:hypothetical protein